MLGSKLQQLRVTSTRIEIRLGVIGQYRRMLSQVSEIRSNAHSWHLRQQQHIEHFEPNPTPNIELIVEFHIRHKPGMGTAVIQVLLYVYVETTLVSLLLYVVFLSYTKYTRIRQLHTPHEQARS